jgi:hypothetical protein
MSKKSEGEGVAGPPADESPEQKESLKEESLSLKHLLTHLPFNKYCAACQRAQMSNAKSHTSGGIDGHEYKVFGEHVTADTMVLHGLKDRGFKGEKNAIVFYDFGTKTHECIPAKSRRDGHTDETFREFIGPFDTVKKFLQ